MNEIVPDDQRQSWSNDEHDSTNHEPINRPAVKNLSYRPDGATNAVGSCVICGEIIRKPKRGPLGKTCSNSCKQKLYRSKPVTPLPQVSKTRNTSPEGAYNAVNIVILSEYDRLSNPMFDWELAEELAHEFTRSIDFVKRGILACREAGVSPQYFIDRHLHKKPIPMNKHVDLCFRKILDEAQSR